MRRMTAGLLFVALVLIAALALLIEFAVSVVRALLNAAHRAFRDLF